MEYCYSHAIDPLSYDSQGLCDGLSVRVHRNADLEEAGIIRLRNDWRKYVGPLPLTTSIGCMGPIYNFTSVTIPECHPSRLEIVSYMMEFGFLNDDITESMTHTEAEALNDEVKAVLNGNAKTSALKIGNSGQKRMIYNVIQELMSIDTFRTKELIRYMTEFFSIPQSRTHFADLEEYLEHRMADCGAMYLIAITTFGMCLTIPPEELDECIKLSRPAWASAALMNDVTSWDKEYKFIQTGERADITNGVWILMKQSFDIDEAKAIILQRSRQFLAEYVDTLKHIHKRTDLSLDSRRLVEAMQYMISGNLIWSLSTPRYHEDRCLTDLQISRIQNGWPGRNTQVSTNGSSYPKDVNQHATNGVPMLGAKVQAVNGLKTANGNGSVNGTEGYDLFISRDIPTLPLKLIISPAHYVASMPSKNVRDKMIDAFNIWLRISEKDVSMIKRIINTVHNASLMLDDVEDESDSRRGKPSAHTIFGPAQTINSASYQVMEAMKEIRKLDSTECLDIFGEEIEKLYVGQSYDLSWKFNVHCPSVEQYIKMIDYKTGALFSLATRLMTSMSETEPKPDFLFLSDLVGRFFQIRDDYMNLKSEEYTRQKGLCEDLDEGKLSLPMVYALQNAPEDVSWILRNLLSQRRITGRMTTAHKHLVMEHLEQTGSIRYTEAVLQNLYHKIVAEVHGIEAFFGVKNPQLTMMMEVLQV
ncbi:putative geranylgeranyl diphosphate synthase [Nemania sp. FL0916]|nr:putative geranylgeranyl diphosphate synthase [Nemania sp. FL0916]